MSRELAEQMGFKIGEKVLYPNYTPYVVIMEMVTVKDVRSLYDAEEDYDSEIVMYVEEFEGYINPLSVYTKEQIIKMFDE